jgi:adenine-specific DNA-methyltransferase
MENDVKQGLKSLNFFQWQLHFHDVFQEKGGFDIVIGNPPYVRQEEIKELKPALQIEYECYAGTADLFVYFYERAFQLLRSGGSLAYITSNKYMRSGYGEKLRQFLSSQGTIQHLIDFGDTPVFEAIAYPSIILATKSLPKDHSIKALTWDAEKSIDNLSAEFRSSGFTIEQKELTADGWRLESPVTLRLMEKLRAAGQPLGEYVNGRFYYGIKTGFNEAFVVDRVTRDRLIAEHPSSAEVLRPFLRGRDIKRWRAESQDLWLIFIPWHFPLHTDESIIGSSDKAEKKFEKLYPAIFNHLVKFKDQLSARNKAETGIRYEWYALQRCAATYWEEFDQPKILYQEIASHQAFSWDDSGMYSNNKTFLIPGADFYLLGILNSKPVWCFLNHIASKLQGGAYAMQTTYISQVPIPKASASDRKAISSLVKKCLEAQGQGVNLWESEINDRVARLYGLTDAEIAQIEGDK